MLEGLNKQIFCVAIRKKELPNVRKNSRSSYEYILFPPYGDPTFRPQSLFYTINWRLQKIGGSSGSGWNMLPWIWKNWQFGVGILLLFLHFGCFTSIRYKLLPSSLLGNDTFLKNWEGVLELKNNSGHLLILFAFPDRRNDILNNLRNFFFTFHTSLLHPAFQNHGKSGLKPNKIEYHFILGGNPRF